MGELPKKIGGALPVVGGFLSGISDVFNAASSVWSVKKQESLQREAWAREDNSIQRRVADLKAAGLSPVLAAGQGAQSSGPINVGQPSFQATGVSKAMELMKMKQDIATTEAQKLALMSTVNKNNMDTLVAGKEVEKKGLEIQRQNLENAIRARDFDIIKRLGIRSDINGQAANLGQLLEGGKNIVSKIGSIPAVSAAISQGAKLTDKPGYRWTGKSWVKEDPVSRSGSQPVRGPR